VHRAEELDQDAIESAIVVFMWPFDDRPAFGD
jgi:hypothetical protein